MMDTGRTRVPTQVSRTCAELCPWRQTKEFLPARKRFSLVRTWIEFLLGQDLDRVLFSHLCMDSYFIPDSQLHPMSLGAILTACLHSLAQFLNCQQLSRCLGTQGGGVLQPTAQVRTM